MALPTDWQDRIQKEEGIRTLALGPQAYVQVNDPRYVSDAYQYYLQGMGGGPDAATIPAAPVVQDPTTMIPQTGGEGGAGITAASVVQPTGGGAQNPLTQMVTTPTGETMTVKQAMTQDPAYSLPGQSDPFLASGAAGGARLPATQATTTLPSGDVFATDDPMLQEKMDYTEKTPTWWESARDKFVQTGQDVGNTFKNLTGQGIDVGKMAGSAILNFVQPGLGLAAQMIPKDTSEDTWNRQFAVGGEGFQDIATSDPDLAKRLEGYSKDLIAGTGGNKDPFGRNTVSMFGDYEKALAEDLQYRGDNQFNKDKQAYAQAYFDKKGIGLNPNEAKAFEEKYGISPTGAPVTRDRLIDEGIAAADQEDDMFEPTIIPKEKPVVDVTKPGTLASDKWNLLDTTEVDVSDEDLLGPQTPTGIEGPPSIISQPTPDNILAGTDDAFSYLDVSDEDLYGGFEQPTEEPVTGIIGPAGTEPFVSDFGAPVDEYQGFIESTPEPTPTFEPRGGGADRDPAPSSPAPRDTGSDYGQFDRAVDRSTPDYSGVTTGGPPSRGGSAGGPPSQGGGGGGGGGKSIVCTAMYQTTGLEDWSKAMKIWYIYQKKYLTIQHQEGYHKLFKPFVKGMHKSNIIKAIGAHVARHRTQDLKHVMFGSKPSWLGRIYRKILEPICYWVGKYAKR